MVAEESLLWERRNKLLPINTLILASFLMFATVVFLYLHHYSVEAIVLGAFLVWAIFFGYYWRFILFSMAGLS